MNMFNVLGSSGISLHSLRPCFVMHCIFCSIFAVKIPPMKRQHIVLLIIALFSLGSCVTMKKFNDLEKKCTTETEQLKQENEQLSVQARELKFKVQQMEEKIRSLASDSADLMQQLEMLRKNYNQLDRAYNELQAAQEELLKGNERETARLLKKLQASQEELTDRENRLKTLERDLQEKKMILDRMAVELDQRNARMKELETILYRKDSTVKALKNKVSDALLGFEKEGLSVNIRNGKVYVSLEEKLLFQSGSTEVDPRGIAALKRLAKVLEQNPDINITIEGHTDDVPVIPSASIRDNWDLSVKRATAIVRILLDGTKIDPRRLTASGRGEFMPVDPAKTKEARQKNRRTEIILTPKLDELLKILESE